MVIPPFPPPPNMHTHSVPMFTCVHVTHTALLSLHRCLSPSFSPPKAKEEAAWAGLGWAWPGWLGQAGHWLLRPCPRMLSTEHLPFRARQGEEGWGASSSRPGSPASWAWDLPPLSRCPLPPSPWVRLDSPKATPGPALVLGSWPPPDWWGRLPTPTPAPQNTTRGLGLSPG